MKRILLIAISVCCLYSCKKADTSTSANNGGSNASVTGLKITNIATGTQIFESTTTVWYAPSGVCKIGISGNSTANTSWKVAATFHRYPSHTQLIQGLGIQESDLTLPYDQKDININNTSGYNGDIEVTLTFTPTAPYVGNQKIVFLVRKT